MKKLILTLCFLLVSSMANATQIIDESGGNAATTTDMEMLTNVDLNAVQEAFNGADPKANVKHETYNPSVTYKIRTRVFMGTMILLPPGEIIKSWDLGDSYNFKFVPKDKEGMKHIFTVQSKNYGADTNLIIIGESGNIYSFYIRADSTKSNYVPDLVVYIEDDSIKPKSAKMTLEKPTTKKAAGEKTAANSEDQEPDGEYLRDLPDVPADKFNYNYVLKAGDEGLAPLRIKDNGYWTWFVYSDEGNLDKVKVPAVYQVVDGYDTLVNTRIDGGSLVAETVAKKWTIRRGEAHLCVRAK